MKRGPEPHLVLGYWGRLSARFIKCGCELRRLALNQFGAIDNIRVVVSAGLLH